MREDLQDAMACIDWAVAQLPPLSKRIDEWLAANVDVGPREEPPPATHNRIVAVQKAPLPLAFNVEVGACINVLRSSLDMLATALAHRHSIPRPDKAYFPIVQSEADFRARKFRGKEFIDGLPLQERAFIEGLKPYQGGNPTLWLLHQLDIMRKHRRLLAVDVRPIIITLRPTNFAFDLDGFTPARAKPFRVNEETILGFIRKDASDHEAKFTAYVSIYEPTLVAREPFTALLYHLANHCQFVVSLFA